MAAKIRPERPDKLGGPELELITLQVAAPRRGTGVAGALVDAAIGAADAVVRVFAANGRAIAFYRKAGSNRTPRHDRSGDVPEIRINRVR